MEKIATTQDIDKSFMEILEKIQHGLMENEANRFNTFNEDMKKTIQNMDKIKTDNPKFNEFISKFSQDKKNMTNGEIQKIAKKLMIAFLYINTETEVTVEENEK
jgi:hypothetical protein